MEDTHSQMLMEEGTENNKHLLTGSTRQLEDSKRTRRRDYLKDFDDSDLIHGKTYNKRYNI